MLFQVKVRVNLVTMAAFGSALQKGELDRGCIRGETHCLKDDPAVGFSIWEADSFASFEAVFQAWRPFYLEVEVREVVTPLEAMGMLMANARGS